MIFVPAILYLEKLPGQEENTPEQQTAKAQKLTYTQTYRQAQVTFAIKHRVAILIIALAVIAISAWGTSKLFVDDNGVAYFRQGTQVRKDDAALSHYFGGTHMFSVIVTGPEKDSIKEPVILKKYGKLTARHSSQISGGRQNHVHRRLYQKDEHGDERR